MKKSFIVVTICYLLAAFPAAAQTFEIGGQENQPAPKQKKQGGSANVASPNAKKSGPAASEGGIGWGSSIEVGRLARAAEDALKKGNAAAAAEYAQRAANAAPGNPKLWFLVGYTSRLAGRYQSSLDAYTRGLKAEPNSVEGLSGLAQTYARMGKTDEAKRLLMQVIAANPKRASDLQIAGELFMQTGDLGRGVGLLQRAEAIQPSAHTELLMAIGYMKLKQPARAKELLDMAKKRAPKNTDIFRAVGTYYRETKDYKSAIETLKTAPRKTPDLLADLGFTYELNGDKKEAADAYSRAADAAPRQINYQLSAANAQIRAGNTGKGRSYLQRAEGIDANHYRLHAIRAGLAKQENRAPDAIREYNLAISHLPEAVPEGVLYPIQLRLNLAELYKDSGDEAASKQQLALAEQTINKLNIEGPAKAEFLRVRASIKTAGNDYAGAEADLKQALQLDPKNVNVTLQYANLLWKMQRKNDARNLYLTVLKEDGSNRYALEGLGYLARDMGDNKTAEQFFTRLAAAYPNDYVPYLALGDMYAAMRQWDRALAAYDKGHKLAPQNALIVAGGANAAIESHQLPVAAKWLERASGAMNDDPRVMRERERYLFHTGKYAESARLGQRVLQALPKDREGSVYLAYDLYNMGRYDDVLALVNRYENILSKEPNFPLLAGHVHKQSQLLDDSFDDYTRALQRDPKMVEAFINRGYVLNDLQNAEAAKQDFTEALKLAPKNGVAHLGMAFSELQLRHGRPALDHVDTAAKLMGESGATHLARATAYRQQRLLERAEKEYRAAVKFAPADLSLHLALADTLYHMRHYGQAITALNEALGLSPDDPFIYAQMAHAHAQLRHRDETLRYVKAAEQQGVDQSAVLLATGDALMILGERQAAMDRFERALEAPDANRVQARLAFAKLMVRDGHWDDARQQISLAFAEARIGEASPITADDLIEAANMFLAMHEFELATRYFARAKAAGAADEVIAIGMANTYIAQGNSGEAAAELASLGNPAEFDQNYDYLLAQANIYRQQHQTLRALTAFARANQLAGEDDQIAERALYEVAGEEGMRLNDRFSAGSNLSIQPLFEDATVYMMDARLFNASGALLPPPRSSLETRWTNGFRVHQGSLPVISGFFQVRNARGEISLPSESLIINRNTYDYAWNGALNPVLRVGRNTVSFNTGLQYTARRDHESPLEMNQNLFRQFVYLSTNALGNWLSIRGSAYHEAGPFTQRNLHSRDLGARLDFTVGRPWGRTALLTGYSVRDLLFDPLVREYFSTSAYVGLQHKFGQKLRVAALGEVVRSWRVQDQVFAIGQMMRPGGEVEYRINNRWLVSGSGAFSRGFGAHDYDNVQSGFFISYVRPFRRMLNDGIGEVPVEYPIRFSIGMEQQSFTSFAGRGQATFRPVVRLSLF